MSWTIVAREEERRCHVFFEGWADCDRHGRVNSYTLTMSPPTATLDLVSPWSSSLAFYEEFVSLLGLPSIELHPLAIGELMDAEHEGHATAQWRFKDADYSAVVAKVRHFLMPEKSTPSMEE